MVKYHINPETQTPSLCRAKRGKCPFGGPDKHYNTYEEAQDVCDEIAYNEFVVETDPMTAPQEVLDNIHVMKYYEKTIDDAYAQFSDEDIIDALENQDNLPQLSMGIFYEVGLKDRVKENPELLTAAIKSPSLPPEVKDDIINNAQNYSEFTVDKFAENPSLSADDLIQLSRGHSYNIKKKTMMKDPRFTAEKINEIYEDIRANGVKNYPGWALLSVFNRQAAPDMKDKAIQGRLLARVRDLDQEGR